jgi:Tfp pilus assembly protein PilV
MLRAFKKRQAGVTLFEVLLVLFVAAFIAAAVGTIYAKVTLTFKQNQLQTSVQQLTANITATYSGSGNADYTGINPTSLIAGGLVPDEMHSASGALTNPWMSTGAWNVAPGNPPTSYSVTLNGIPSGACSALYQGMSKISTASTMLVNGKTTASPSDAVGNCIQDTNVITLNVN